MALLSRETYCEPLARQKRLWRVAVPIIALVGVALWAVPKYETQFFPVIADVSIAERLPSERGRTRFTLAFVKLQDCTRLWTVWRTGTPENPGKFGFVTVPTQQYGAGGDISYVQEIELYPPDAETFFGLSGFNCGLPWTTKQVIGPFLNWHWRQP